MAVSRRTEFGRVIRRLTKRGRRRLIYMGLSVALPLLRLLPWEAGRALGRFAGSLGFRLARRERDLALDQLRSAFAEKMSRAERERVCRRMFRNVGEGAMEMMLLPKKFGPALVRMVDGEDCRRNLNRLLEVGRGSIIITGHLGNWELLGAWGGYLFPLSIVARRIYYEPFDRMIVGMRTRLGMRTIYRDTSPREILRRLRKNEVVAILPDQDVSDVAGVFVDFFGQPAWTPTAPVSLALHSGAPILFAFILRQGRGFRIENRPFELVRTGDRQKDLQVNTQRWSDLLEELIVSHADQWPWYHRRWKTDAAVLDRKRERRKGGRRPRR